jgi:uncharacterized damage-inducible protein DinB
MSLNRKEVPMPGLVSPVIDERDALLSFLDQERLVLTLTAYGLTDEEARLSPSASALSIAGLIKHVTAVESFWIDIVLGRPSADDQYEDNFLVGPDETLASILDLYGQVGVETAAVIGAITDLGRPVPVPAGVPWFPDDVDAWSVRWVLVHLITETARHAGHADIVRETIDGATAFPLMAAAEGWPATDWMQPWTRDPLALSGV